MTPCSTTVQPKPLYTQPLTYWSLSTFGQTATSEHSNMMAPILRSGQTSKTANNHVGVGPSTIPVIDTPDTANGSDSEAVKADNPNDTNKDVEAAMAHNQEVIDRQWRQIQRVQQEIKYEENKQELEKLNARLREGPKAAMTMPENDGGFTPGVQHWAMTDIAPPPFWRLVKPREPCPYAGGPKGSRRWLQEYLDKINQNRSWCQSNSQLNGISSSGQAPT